MTTVDILYPSFQAMELLKNQGRQHPVEILSYCCKICSKRFVSGRALGGHMRAHIPAPMPADTFTQTEFQKSKRPRDSDDKSLEEKDDEEGNGENLICDLCGKEFRFWKDLFGHMNCRCETHQDSGDAHLEESQKHETQDDEEERTESKVEIEIEMDHPSENSSRFDKWTKEKRIKRPRYALQLNQHEQFGSATNNEEEDIAVCLVMLASGVNTAQNPQFQVGAVEPESGYLKLPNNGSQLPESISKKLKYKKIDGDAGLYDDDEAKKGRYKCTTCNNVFDSYQALGGHRASHSKVKGCFTQIEDENESLEEQITDEELNTGLDSQLPHNFHKSLPMERTKDSCAKARDETRTIQPASFSGKKTPRVHECSICHRGFASGQALGGHKRCHWVSAGASDSVSTSSSNKETPVLQQLLPARVELLDLNLPAPVDDDCDAGNLNNLGSSAVDSHGASDAQTHSPPCSQSWLMGMSYPKLGLFLSNNYSYISKSDDDAQTHSPVDDDCDAGNLNNLGGNTVDSHGASDAQTLSPPYLLSWLMGNYPKQGLFLYNNHNHLSKDDEADSKVGKDSGFRRGYDSEFPVTAQSWLQL